MPRVLLSLLCVIPVTPSSSGESDRTEREIMPDEDYVYDEDTGEWLPASELAARQAAA